MLGDFIGELKGKITGQSFKCRCSKDGDKLLSTHAKLES